MTFFRTTRSEAEGRPGLNLTTILEGVPVYVYESLSGHFETHPLILTTRGPRIAIETDPTLAELVADLLRRLALGHKDNDDEH